MRTNQLDIIPTIGIDPGAQWVGVCARIGTSAVDACSLRRGSMDAQGFIDRVVDTVEAMMTGHVHLAADAAAEWDVTVTDRPWRIAVEDVHRPRPYIRGPNGQARKTLGAQFAWDVAQVTMILGAILGAYPGAVVVAPGRFDEVHLPRHGGSGTPADYWPAELLGAPPRAFMASDGERQHQRAAYNIAGAAFQARPLRRRVAA